jgi:hypothetical protein
MRALEKRVLPSWETEPEQFKIASDALLIRGPFIEPRHSIARSCEAIEVTTDRRDSFIVDHCGRRTELHVRNPRGILEFFTCLRQSCFYLETTSLSHHVWAPILRALINTGRRVLCTYVEPLEYSPNEVAQEGEIYDLSEKIEGLDAIPGFASFHDEFSTDFCFVPLLGFEGRRLAYVVEQVQPPEGRTVPIVGAPGFRLEYPFHAFQGNFRPLFEERAWSNIRFVPANCPFSLYYALEEVYEEYNANLLKIAPIGTKPHALGAFLYALHSRRQIEFVYDFPIRKPKRTLGLSRVLVYDVSAFLEL